MLGGRAMGAELATYRLCIVNVARKEEQGSQQNLLAWNAKSLEDGGRAQHATAGPVVCNAASRGGKQQILDCRGGRRDVFHIGQRGFKNRRFREG